MSVNTEVGEDASQINDQPEQPSNGEGINASKERIEEVIACGIKDSIKIQTSIACGMGPPSTLIGSRASYPPMRRISPEIIDVGWTSSRRPSTLIGYDTFDPSERRTSNEIIKHHVQIGATFTSQSLPGQDVVLVRPGTHDGPTNHKDRGRSLVLQNGDERIPEEEVVCRFCFVKLKEESKVLKMNCRCSNAFTHEECLANWSREKGNSNCDFCGQEVQSFPVTLFGGFNSSQRIDSQGTKKHWLISWLLRIFKGGY